MPWMMATEEHTWTQPFRNRSTSAWNNVELNQDQKALRLVQEVVKNFHSIDFAMRPADIPEEEVGKGSNLA